MVGPDHEQVWSAPFTDNADGLLPFGEIRMVPVFGDERVWVLSSYPPPSLTIRGAGSAALYDYDGVGWNELAATQVDRVWPARALDTGELIGNVGPGNGPLELVRLRALDGGTVDMIDRREDLRGGWR